MNRWLAMMLCLLAVPAGAIERHDIAGLSVVVETVEDAVEVDGLRMRIVRASGSAVPDLVRRITARWEAEGSLVRTLHEGGWQLRSRWSAGHSEVLQWRDGPAPAELLHSRLEPVTASLARRGDPFPVPAACAWGRSVRAGSGRTPYLQQSAFCRATVRQVMPLVRVTLAAAGWHIRAGSSATLHLARAASQASLWLVPHATGNGSWLVWIDHAGSP